MTSQKLVVIHSINLYDALYAEPHQFCHNSFLLIGGGLTGESEDDSREFSTVWRFSIFYSGALNKI
jgi:hypothetical protein